MKFRYGICRQERKPHRKSRTVTQNHEGDLPAVTLRTVLDMVAEKHPGWSLMGYEPPDALCQTCGYRLDLTEIASGGRCTNENCFEAGNLVPVPMGGLKSISN